MDLIYPLLDIGFCWNGLFDNDSEVNKDWNSGPSMVFQTRLIVGNVSAIALDASMRGWI